MMKRGVELSMNVIIIAAIALVVLVVLVLLVTRGAEQVGTGTGCRSAGGSCYDLGDTGTCQEIGDDYTSLGRKDCPESEWCCIQPV